MPAHQPNDPKQQNRPTLASLALLRRLNGQTGQTEILAVRRNLKQAGIEDLWGLPGGKVEFGETVLMAAKRELREETGLQATPVKIVDWFEQISAHGHFVLAVVWLEKPEGELTLTPELKEARWIGLDELQNVECHPQLARLARMEIK